MRSGLLVLLGALPLVAFAQPLDLKTGGWEVSVTTTGSDAPDKQTFVSCVTQSELVSGAAFEGSDAAHCTRKGVVRTTQRYEFDETCRDPEPSQGHVSFEATSRDAYVGSIDRTLEGGARVHIAIVGFWVSATCSDEIDD